MKKQDTPITYTAGEAVAIFSAQGEFISKLNDFIYTDDFISLYPSIQTIMLENKKFHEAVYKKTAAFLSEVLENKAPMNIYNKDTGTNIKPKSCI